MLVVFITKCFHLYSSRKHKVEKNVASKVDWGGKKYAGILLQMKSFSPQLTWGVGSFRADVTHLGRPECNERP